MLIIVEFLGGISFFLFGLKVMSSGLEKLAGSKLQSVLEKMTSSTPKGLLLGAGATVGLQSSSAVTVMLVGLVNSGLITLHQAVPVIFGANVGTTATSWVLSLSGISSSNPLVVLLTPKGFAPLFAFLGVILYSVSKAPRVKNTGYILLGFGILMEGMETMKNALQPVTHSEGFKGVLLLFENPLLAILAGLVFTALVQSSSASVGVLQALAITGAVPYRVAVPLIVGQNLGTCVTSFVAAIGTKSSAKGVVVVHALFNLLGGVPFLAVYYLLGLVPGFPYYHGNVTAFGVAVVHTVLNLFSAVLLVPFRGKVEKVAEKIIRN